VSVLGASLAALVLTASGCGKGKGKEPGSTATSDGKPGAVAAGERGDALFLAAAPADVPELLDADLEAMGIKRFYIAAAKLGADGKITPLPPPPPMKRSVIFTVMADPGAANQLNAPNGDTVGNNWSRQLKPLLDEAKAWGSVVGVHIHILPTGAQATTLAAALKTLRKSSGLPVSVTLPADVAPALWKPLSGSADEALVFSLGRRIETGDRLVGELTEASAKAFPIPFRLLVVLGGYGMAGKDGNFSGRRIPDGEIDTLSEDRGLDFDFAQVLSNEPGNNYKFKPRPGGDPRKSSLAADGGYAKFQIVTFSDAVKHLSAAGRWIGAPLKGRAFLVDGLPKDGHLLGFPAVRAYLTAKPTDPKLLIEPGASTTGRGFTEFSLRVTNIAPTPTDLSHFNNWIQIRVEGGAVVSVKPGDFDRFELLSSTDERGKPAQTGKAVVARLFENLFAAEETNSAGPFRVVGVKPKAFVAYKLSLADGRTVEGPESELQLAPPAPAPKAKASGPVLKGRKKG